MSFKPDMSYAAMSASNQKDVMTRNNIKNISRNIFQNMEEDKGNINLESLKNVIDEYIDQSNVNYGYSADGHAFQLNEDMKVKPFLIPANPEQAIKNDEELGINRYQHLSRRTLWRYNDETKNYEPFMET
ncbi:uncharacterized protein LOC119662451 [Teleopsis dalmanni]|uniref:uncharacterized protein LOC119662451 n=1 Tax=Teleopsis dalmanni TaxID=139649 RepID=UPI0018CD8E9C|nr:uncharacterized protein LOC119662451 [Teleopsis dalmanni]